MYTYIKRLLVSLFSPQLVQSLRIALLKKVLLKKRIHQRKLLRIKMKAFQKVIVGHG